MSQSLEIEMSIEGMSCASCVRHVEKALNAVSGVSHASVNLATEIAKVTIENNVPHELLISAVEKAGYNAKIIIVDKKTGLALNTFEKKKYKVNETWKLVTSLFLRFH